MDLKTLFGLNDTPTESRGENVLPQSKPACSSDYTLKLDQWTVRRGETLVEDDAQTAADLFGVMFESEPQFNERCVDRVREQFIRSLVETPDYEELHRNTMCDEVTSEIATLSLVEQLSKLRSAYPDPTSEPDEIGTSVAAGKAVMDASERVEELIEAQLAMGMGTGSGGSNDPKRTAAIYKRVRNSAQLRRICELAGRFRRVAQSKQRNKNVHGYDDVVGIELDGELGRILPVELAKLGVAGEFRLDTVRRLIERQLQCREYKAIEPVAKGPIIICVDESGSMSGSKVQTAKALALALAWVAKHQKRWCGLVAYSGDTGHRLLSLPPGHWDELLVLDWLERFLGRGSCLDVPVRELPQFYEQLGPPRFKTDVIMITDAICTIPEKIRTNFQTWKSEKEVRVYSLIIDSEPGDLEKISDEWWSVNSIEAEGEEVGKVLSI